MPAEKWLIKESELDDEQYAIKELDTQRSYVIQGCAGSGKTILALWRAKELQDSSKGTFFVLVFTKALRKFIDDGIREIGIDTIRVLYQWEWENKLNKPEADFFIVDEAQDFTPSEVRFLANQAEVSIMLFGDTDQQVFNDKNVTIDGNPRKEATARMTSIADLLKVEIRTLKYNYRLPKRIARFVDLARMSELLEPRCKNEGSFYPIIKKCSNNEEELNWIIQKIKENNLKDVGILVPFGDNVKFIYEYFNQYDLNPECYFRTDKDSVFSLDFSTPNPKILTYHSAKGLQFQSVFLPFCEVNHDFYKKPLYVALSRAYERLYISHTNHISYFLNKIPKAIQGRVIYEDDNTQVLRPNTMTVTAQSESIDESYDDLPF